MHRDKRSCGVGIACGFHAWRISVMSLGDFINEQQLVLIADRDDGVHIADVEVNADPSGWFSSSSLIVVTCLAKVKPVVNLAGVEIDELSIEICLQQARS